MLIGCGIQHNPVADRKCFLLEVGKLEELGVGVEIWAFQVLYKGRIAVFLIANMSVYITTSDRKSRWGENIVVMVKS